MKVFILIFISLTQSCSVTPDFVFATLEEEVDYAGGIVIGTVTDVSNPFSATVTLKDLTFLRGCI